MKLDIISGFLGAGKTTLIKKLMNEIYSNEKILIIENEFGEISIDATILKKNGYQLKEINSGCICCNISGDFKTVLKEIIKTIQVDRILVEPSGIANLSDIVKICEELVEVERKFVVIDAQKFKIHLNNFEVFFKNQVENANIIVLSRLDYPIQIEPIIEDIMLLNQDCIIYAKNYNEFEFKDIDTYCKKEAITINAKHKFYNKVYIFNHSISKSKFNKILTYIKQKQYLRAKGVVLVEQNWTHFEYASNTFQIEPFEAQTQSSFVIIDDKEVTYEP